MLFVLGTVLFIDFVFGTILFIDFVYLLILFILRLNMLCLFCLLTLFWVLFCLLTLSIYWYYWFCYVLLSLRMSLRMSVFACFACSVLLWASIAVDLLVCWPNWISCQNKPKTQTNKQTNKRTLNKNCKIVYKQNSSENKIDKQNSTQHKQHTRNDTKQQ